MMMTSVGTGNNLCSDEDCKDLDSNCGDWIAADQSCVAALAILKSEHVGYVEAKLFSYYSQFTYGEEIQFSLADTNMHSSKALNYTAFAWGINQGNQELHRFVTIEEGPVSNNRIRFRLVDIGRISFSRDLPVHDLVREWTLVDSRTLESG
uniref:Uncharacterized protein n=1 Tax=Ditylenchus dipsaci TaxID=166011 RepID=A0A915EQ63_9BILA